MKILDRYLIKQFLNVLGFAIIAFIIIFVVVDLVENLDQFIDKQVPRPIVARYYFYYLPYIIILVLPVALLLSSLFSIGQLAKFNELTAMKASGISLYRVAAPLLVLAFLWSFFALAFGELVMPLANQKKFEIKRLFLDRIPPNIFYRRSDLYVLEGRNTRVRIGYFDGVKKVAHQVSVQYFQDDRLHRRIDVRKMYWQEGRWILEDGFVRDFSDDTETLQPLVRWERSDFSFTPEDLAKIHKQPEEMGYFELREFIDKIRRVGGNPQKWLVDLRLKISFPFSNFIIVLFGIPLAYNRRRSGAAVGFGISLTICFIFFGLVKTGQTLGHNGTLPPFWAAWLSDLIFLAIGLALMLKAPK